MFYHDHAYGITRLNVYAGEAAGYLVTDPVEQTLVNGGTIPGTKCRPAGTIPATEIPLIIQDKTFVPSESQLAVQDPTWNWGSTPGTVHDRRPVVPACLYAEPEPIRSHGSQRRWPLGLWSVVLAAVHTTLHIVNVHQPTVPIRHQPAGGTEQSRHAESFPCAGRLHGYSAGQRDCLSLSDCESPGLPVPHPERSQRPHA